MSDPTSSYWVYPSVKGALVTRPAEDAATVADLFQNNKIPALDTAWTRRIDARDDKEARFLYIHHGHYEIVRLYAQSNPAAQLTPCVRIASDFYNLYHRLRKPG